MHLEPLLHIILLDSNPKWCLARKNVLVLSGWMVQLIPVSVEKGAGIAILWHNWLYLTH